MIKTLSLILILSLISLNSSLSAFKSSNDCISSEKWKNFKESFGNFKIQFFNEAVACSNYISPKKVSPIDNKIPDCLSKQKWIDYKKDHSLVYDSSENLNENYACQNFFIADQLITNNNNKSDKDIQDIILRHNEFSAWGPNDTKSHKGISYGSKMSAQRYVSNNEPLCESDDKCQKERSLLDDFGMPYTIFNGSFKYDYNTNKDWMSYTRESYAVNGKVWAIDKEYIDDNQGSCSNCWAWTAVASLEGAIWKKTNKKVKLSVQQLTDCANDNYGNDGCNGGNVWNAFKYIYENGLVLDSAYPSYSSKILIPGKCQYNATLKWASKNDATYTGSINGLPYNDFVGLIKEFVWINPGSDLALKQALDKYGPVSVAIDSSNPSFQSYHTGIYAKNGDCKKYEPDHSLLLVGYGDGRKDNGWTTYWKLRNQWGRTWGRESSGNAKEYGGSIYLSRKIINNCGISSYASVPVPYDPSSVSIKNKNTNSKLQF